MDLKKQFGKIIAALLLLVALMLPTAIDFIHMFEGHDHITCNDSTTHVHKSVVKCDICHFNLASFNYDIAEYPNLLLSKIPQKNEVNFTSLLFNSNKLTNTQLRAPPIFS